MKRIRLICLVFMAALIVANSGLVLSANGNCCNAFKDHCDDFCSDHGGMMMTNCYGLYCTETCWCWDNAEHDHPGGSYCPPCS